MDRACFFRECQKGSSGGVPKRTAVAASSPMPTSTSGTSLEESMKNINLIDLDEAQPNAAPSSGLAPSTLVQEENITPNLVESSEAPISRPPAMEGQQDSDVNHTKPKEEVNSRLQSLFQTPQVNGTTKHTPVAQEPLPARSTGARDGNANPAELRANREWIAKLNAAAPKPLPKPLKKRSGEVLVVSFLLVDFLARRLCELNVVGLKVGSSPKNVLLTIDFYLFPDVLDWSSCRIRLNANDPHFEPFQLRSPRHPSHGLCFAGQLSKRVSARACTASSQARMKVRYSSRHSSTPSGNPSAIHYLALEIYFYPRNLQVSAPHPSSFLPSESDVHLSKQHDEYPQ